jgi:peptidoglycan/LPS O-acetylase OafA/YrhL
MFFSFVIGSNTALDAFIFISGFLGTYKCLQIYEANGGKLYFTDALKLYARKILRIAPLFYAVFFFGWMIGARLQNGPLWFSYQSLFY